MSEERIIAYEGKEPYAFVSYAHKDSNIVYPVIKKLTEKGYRIWYDEGIPLVADYGSVLYNHIMNCDVFIIFKSNSSVASADVGKEIHHAIDFGKRIVQVVIDRGAQYTPDIAYHLHNALQYIDINTGPEEFYRKLCAALDDRGWVNTDGSRKKSGSGTAYIIAAIIIVGALTLLIMLLRPNDTVTADPPGSAATTAEPTTGGTGITEHNDRPSVGDHICYGNYPQSGSSPEPIQWQVLAVKDDKALLISDMLLDSQPYNLRKTSVTWENCYLRGWLNDDFLNTAFTSDERQRIAEVTNSNPKNPKYGTAGGSATTDRIFCLSIDEFQNYCDHGVQTKGVPTQYAMDQGCWITDKYSSGSIKYTGWWWLRSSGDDTDRAAGVNARGVLDRSGYDIEQKTGSVRPSFWLILE